MFKAFRAVPWILVIAALRVVYDHWQRMDDADRRRVTEIVRNSKGLPNKMTRQERRDLVDIGKRLDHIGLGRDLAATAAPFPTPGLKTKADKRAAKTQAKAQAEANG